MAPCASDAHHVDPSDRPAWPFRPQPTRFHMPFRRKGTLFVTRIWPCLDQIFFDFNTVALLFLFDKQYPIMEQLGLKDSSRDLQINCVISFLSIFNVLCMCRKIRCDEKSCKVLGFRVYLNNAYAKKAK
jgi:hypothetical protein